MTFSFLTALLVFNGSAQVVDDFTDGDFTANPTWSGDDSEFTVDGSNQLRLNNTFPASNNESYLSLPSESINNAVWEFKVGFEGLSSGSTGGLSSTNQMLIFLVSDQANLEGSVNGYYINVGNTEDEISLYSTNSGIPLINGTDDVTQLSSGFISIRVTRDDAGNWELLIDQAGGSSYSSEGTAFNDDFTSSSYFGIVCDYTSTRATNFFFDDFSVTGTGPIDTTPPTIQSATAVSNTQVDVQFSEDLDATTAQNASNYAIDGSIAITSATLDADNSLVHLTTSELTNGSTYTLTVNSVEDLSANVIVADSEEPFEYLVFEEAEALDVVINEFMADPNPVLTTLPDAEYVELYNRSGKYFNLENWTLDGNTLPAFTLAPDAYVLVVEDDDLALFAAFSDVLPITTLSLNNTTTDDIVLQDDNAVTIHSISFLGSTGGISTELINPNGPDYSENNYGLSIDPDGGTPGEQNSIFDDTPDTTPPAITSISVVSNTALDVSFNEILEETSAESIGNYSIDGGISILTAMRDDANNQLVHLTVDPLVSGQVRTLTVNGVQDLSGNTTTNATAQFEYLETEEAVAGDVIINEFLSNPVDNNDDFIELLNVSDKFIDMAGWNISDESSTSEDLPSFILRPGSYLIIYDEDATIDYSAFGDALTIASLTLNNSDDQITITNGSDVEIDFLAYQDEQEDGVSLELVNPEAPCRSLSGYLPSTAVSGSTPGVQNSVFDDTPDTTPPSVSSYGYTSSLMINFSEVMDAASLLSGTYLAAGLTIDQVIVTGSFPTSVEITFNESITPGETYEFTLSGMSDCWGNELAETSLTFGFGRQPSFNEVIITEILFDETPSVGLPEREFIELFNVSSDVIYMEGVSLIDVSGSTTLPSFNINPGEYKVLTTTSGASEFDDAIGVPSFPSLSNSGEQLILAAGSELIFSISYDPDWHEESRSEGGYSLEMIDVTNPCVESGANWTSSLNPNGGTPGATNSVNNPESVPDNMPPNLINVTAISSDSLRLTFSEKLDPGSILTISYSFSPNVGVQSSSLVPEFPRTIYLKLNSDLAENERYTLSISNVTDCNGNEIADNEIVFALPVEAIEGEVLLSEVLFNPRTNGVDFVEIYNNSDNFITLKNWQLARFNDEGLDGQVILSEEELVLNPRDFLVFTPDAEVLLNNYPKGVASKFFELSPFPGYANDTGTVVLINALEEITERFFYDEEYHFNLLKSVDGVSLERVSYNEATNNSNNWRSASSTVGFATPGYENSQSLNTSSSMARVSADPEVFIPGNSGSGRDFTTINYQFDEPGKFANVNIYDQTGRLVKNLAQGALLSTTGFLRWDGDTNGGNMARVGYYLILFEIYDSSGNSETIKETVVVGRDF